MSSMPRKKGFPHFQFISPSSDSSELPPTLYLLQYFSSALFRSSVVLGNRLSASFLKENTCPAVAIDQESPWAFMDIYI